MSLTTTSRPVLVNRTNFYTNNVPSPWTVLRRAGTKRPASGPQNGGLKKRVKVSSGKEKETQQQEKIIQDDNSDEENDSDTEMASIVDLRARARRHGTVFEMMNAAATGPPRSRQSFSKSFFCLLVLLWRLII